MIWNLCWMTLEKCKIINLPEMDAVKWFNTATNWVNIISLFYHQGDFSYSNSDSYSSVTFVAFHSAPILIYPWFCIWQNEFSFRLGFLHRSPTLSFSVFVNNTIMPPDVKVITNSFLSLRIHTRLFYIFFFLAIATILGNSTCTMHKPTKLSCSPSLILF